MDLVDEIAQRTNLLKEEILRKVEEKYSELSGLITKEGAALLVAKELGAEIKRSLRPLIKDVTDGMKNVNIVGRIFRISNVNEFKKSDGTAGKVVNLWVGDDSGSLRLPLWNDQASAVEDNQFKLGDVVQIFNGLARQNSFGYMEVSLGKYGGMKILDDTGELPQVSYLQEKNLSKNYQRVDVEEASESNLELMGTIVQVLRGDFVFNACPLCNSATKSTDGVFTCSKHGNVTPAAASVISCIIDDGTGDMRVVFFRQVAEILSGVDAQELSKMDKENRLKLLSQKLVGREIVVSGRVRRNSLSSNLEMIATSAKDINPLEESKKLVDSIQFALSG